MKNLPIIGFAVMTGLALALGFSRRLQAAPSATSDMPAKEINRWEPRYMPSDLNDYLASVSKEYYGPAGDAVVLDRWDARARMNGNQTAIPGDAVPLAGYDQP